MKNNERLAELTNDVMSKKINRKQKRKQQANISY